MEGKKVSLSPVYRSPTHARSSSRSNFNQPSRDSDVSELQHDIQSLAFRSAERPPRQALELSMLSSPTVEETSVEHSFRRGPPGPEGEARARGSVREVGRLQNELAFLKAVVSASGMQVPAQPVYLVPSEFFYSLKSSLSRCLSTLDRHLHLLGSHGLPLAHNFQTLRSAASAHFKAYKSLTAEYLLEVFELLAACEDMQKDVYSVYAESLDKVSQEMSFLLNESMRTLLPLAERAGKRRDSDEVSHWNERRIALSEETTSLSLISVKRSLLQDFESLKQRVLRDVFRLRELSPVASPVFKSPPRVTSTIDQSFSSTRSEDARYSLKKGLSELFESLNFTKSEVGKWSWKESPLKPSSLPKVESMADVEAAVRVAKHEVEQIGRVIVAERDAIEKEVRKNSEGNRDTDQFQEEVDALRRENEDLQDKISEIVQECSENRNKIAVLTAEIALWKDKCKGQIATINAERERIEELTRDSEAICLENAFFRESIGSLSMFCNLPLTRNPQSLETIITSVKNRIQEAEETLLMETFEGQYPAKFTPKRLRSSSYATSEESIATSVRYLLRHTEDLLHTLDPSYRKSDSSALSLQEMQRKEYELLGRSKLEVENLIKSKDHWIKNAQNLSAEVSTLRNEITQLQLENSAQIDEITHMRSTSEERNSTESTFFTSLKDAISPLFSDLSPLDTLHDNLPAVVDLLKKKLAEVKQAVIAEEKELAVKQHQLSSLQLQSNKFKSELERSVKRVSEENAALKSQLRENNAEIEGLKDAISHLRNQCADTELVIAFPSFSAASTDEHRTRLQSASSQEDKIAHALDVICQSIQKITDSKTPVPKELLGKLKLAYEEVEKVGKVVAVNCESSVISAEKALRAEFEAEKTAMEAEFQRNTEAAKAELATRVQLLTSEFERKFEPLAKVMDVVSEKTAVCKALRKRLTKIRQATRSTKMARKAVDAEIQYLKNELSALTIHSANTERLLLDELSSLKTENAQKTSESEFSEKTISRLKSELHKLSSTVSSQFATSELTIVFESPDTGDEVHQGKRLQAGMGLEEKIAKGLEAISQSIGNVLGTQCELPQSLIERQKCVYTQMSQVEELVRKLKSDNKDLSALMETREKEMKTRENHLRKEHEDTRKRLLRDVDSIRCEFDAKFQSFSQVPINFSTVESLILKISQVKRALQSLKLSKKSSEVALQRCKAEKEALITRCQEVEITLTELQSGYNLLKDHAINECRKIKEDLTRTDGQFALRAGKISEDIEKMMNAIQAVSGENGNYRVVIERQRAEIEKLQTAIAQLSDTPLVIAFASTDFADIVPTAHRLQAGQTLEEKVFKGFEIVCQRLAQVMDDGGSVPNEVLERQRFVYEGIAALGQRIEELREKVKTGEEKLQSSHDLVASLTEKLQSSSESLSLSQDSVKTLQQESQRIAESLQEMEEKLIATETKLLTSDEKWRDLEGKLRTSEKSLQVTEAKLHNSEDNLKKTEESLRICEENLHKVEEFSRVFQQTSAETVKSLEERLVSTEKRCEQEAKQRYFAHFEVIKGEVDRKCAEIEQSLRKYTQKWVVLDRNKREPAKIVSVVKAQRREREAEIRSLRSDCQTLEKEVVAKEAEVQAGNEEKSSFLNELQVALMKFDLDLQDSEKGDMEKQRKVVNTVGKMVAEVGSLRAEISTIASTLKATEETLIAEKGKSETLRNQLKAAEDSLEVAEATEKKQTSKIAILEAENNTLKQIQEQMSSSDQEKANQLLAVSGEKAEIFEELKGTKSRLEESENYREKLTAELSTAKLEIETVRKSVETTRKLLLDYEKSQAKDMNSLGQTLTDRLSGLMKKTEQRLLAAFSAKFRGYRNTKQQEISVLESQLARANTKVAELASAIDAAEGQLHAVLNVTQQLKLAIAQSDSAKNELSGALEIAKKEAKTEREQKEKLMRQLAIVDVVVGPFRDSADEVVRKRSIHVLEDRINKSADSIIERLQKTLRSKESPCVNLAEKHSLIGKLVDRLIFACEQEKTAREMFTARVPEIMNSSEEVIQGIESTVSASALRLEAVTTKSGNLLETVKKLNARIRAQRTESERLTAELLETGGALKSMKLTSEQSAAEVISLRSALSDLTSANTALKEQLQIETVVLESNVLVDVVPRKVKKGSDLQELLEKGFDYTLALLAKTVGETANCGSELMEKQEFLHQLAVKMCEKYETAKGGVEKVREESETRSEDLKKRVTALVEGKEAQIVSCFDRVKAAKNRWEVARKATESERNQLLQDLVAERKLHQATQEVLESLKSVKSQTDTEVSRLQTEIDSLRQKLATAESGKFALIEQLQQSEFVLSAFSLEDFPDWNPQVSNEYQAKVSKGCDYSIEALSSVLPEPVAPSSVLMEKQWSLHQGILKLTAEYRNLIKEKEKIEKVAADSEEDCSTLRLQLQTAREELSTCASKLERTEAENRSIREQLSISAVEVSFPQNSTDDTEAPPIRSNLEQRLAAGFDFTIRKAAERLETTPQVPLSLIEKQHSLHLLVTQLINVINKNETDIGQFLTQLIEVRENSFAAFAERMNAKVMAAVTRFDKKMIDLKSSVGKRYRIQIINFKYLIRNLRESNFSLKKSISDLEYRLETAKKEGHQLLGQMQKEEIAVAFPFENIEIPVQPHFTDAYHQNLHKGFDYLLRKLGKSVKHEGSVRGSVIEKQREVYNWAIAMGLKFEELKESYSRLNDTKNEEILALNNECKRLQSAYTSLSTDLNFMQSKNEQLEAQIKHFTQKTDYLETEMTDMLKAIWAEEKLAEKEAIPIPEGAEGVLVALRQSCERKFKQFEQETATKSSNLALVERQLDCEREKSERLSQELKESRLQLLESVQASAREREILDKTKACVERLVLVIKHETGEEFFGSNLESDCEKAISAVNSIASKCDSAQNEVKRLTDALEAMHSAVQSLCQTCTSKPILRVSHFSDTEIKSFCGEVSVLTQCLQRSVAEQVKLWNTETHLMKEVLAPNERLELTPISDGNLLDMLSSAKIRTEAGMKLFRELKALPKTIDEMYQSSSKLRSIMTHKPMAEFVVNISRDTIMEMLLKVSDNIEEVGNPSVLADMSATRRTPRQRPSMTTPLSADSHERSSDRSQLIITIEQLNHEVINLQGQLNDSEQKNKMLQEDCEVKESENSFLQEKTMKLEGLVKDLESRLREMRPRRVSEDLDISGSGEDYQQLHQVSESLVKLLDDMKETKRKLLIPKLRKIHSMIFIPKLSLHFDRWKSFAMTNKYATEELYEEDALKQWKLEEVRANPILRNITAVESQSARTIYPFLLYKLADEIMLQKVEMEIKEPERTETLPVFTIEYLTNKHGSRMSALKLMRQIVAALWVADDELYYGQLLSRIFQIKNPLSDNICSYLTRLNFKLMRLVHSFIDYKREGTKHSSERVADFDYISPETGGQMLLADSLTLVYNLQLAQNENICRRILNYLRSENTSVLDYTTFVILHRMKELKVDPKTFFASMGEGVNEVPVSTLAITLKHNLLLCISEKKIRRLLEYMSMTKRGCVTKAEFLRQFSMEMYEMNSDSFTVERYYFLYIVSYVYDRHVAEKLEKAMASYDKFSYLGNPMVYAKALRDLIPEIGDEAITAAISPESPLIKKYGYSRDGFLCFLACSDLGSYLSFPFCNDNLGADTLAVEPAKRKRRRNEFVSQIDDKSMQPRRRKGKNNSVMGLNFPTP